MKKTLALLSTIVLLLSAVSVACAEDVSKSMRIGFASGIGKTKSINNKLSVAGSRYTAKIPRGGKLTIWTWYDNENWYNYVNGKRLDKNGTAFTYTYSGWWARVKVKTGKKWLSAGYTGNYLCIDLSRNYTNKLRTGKIRIWDTYGTCANVVVKQCGVINIQSIKQYANGITTSFEGSYKKLKTAYNNARYRDAYGHWYTTKLKKTAKSFRFTGLVANADYAVSIVPVAKLGKRYITGPVCNMAIMNVVNPGDDAVGTFMNAFSLDAY